MNTWAWDELRAAVREASTALGRALEWADAAELEQALERDERREEREEMVQREVADFYGRAP